MLATLPFAFLSLAMGLLLVARSRRLNRTEAVVSVGAQPLRSRKLAAAQFGRIGAASPTEAIKSMVNVAPAGSPSVALDLEAMDGGPLARIAADDVVMARGWSRGRLVLSFGEMRPAYGRPGPLAAMDAVWEIHLVDAAGRIVRLRGMPGAALDDDLLRLHYRVREARAAHAA